MIKSILILSIFALTSLTFTACTGGGSDESAGTGQQEASNSEQDAQMQTSMMKSAEAALEAKSGSSVSGTCTFVEKDGMVTLAVVIEGAEPGVHAIHIHEKGDCSSEDGKSAGGHWNPTEEAHGAWGGEAHHSGDIGNIEVGEDGTGSIGLTTDRWTIGGDDASKNILGRGVIVHAAGDDFTTQPTGAAGGRVACGVIIAKSE